MADARQLKIGGLQSLFDAVPALSTFTLNQATDQWEVCFKVVNDGSGNLTITHLGFRYGTRTGTPPTYKIGIQGVDTAGVPDGVWKGGATPATATFTPPASTAWNNSWQWVALDNSYVAAPGEDLAVVIVYSGTGTIDASNCSSFTTLMTNCSSNNPYLYTNDNGVRTPGAATSTPVFGYKTATKTYGRPVQSITTDTYQSGSSPNEHGVKFALPADWSDTFKVGQINLLAAPAAGATLLLQLYNGGGATDTTVLQNVQHDTDRQASAGGRRINLPFDETTLSTLTFGNSYRVSLLAQSAVNISIYTLDVASVSDWDAWPGGQDCTLTTLSAGTWTDTPTSRPIIDVVLADITEAVGGAGVARLVGGGLIP